MEKETKPVKFPRYIVAIVVVISGAVGYTFGKNLADKHNAEDAREAAQSEILGR